jgi:uncharacterized protein (UPF0333 family)
MRIQWRWLVPAILLLTGFAVSYVASESLRETARKAWKAEAAQSA